MASSTNLKRYAIPTLDEMENADKDKEPERLFKRQKEFSSHSTRSTTISTENSSEFHSSKVTNNSNLARAKDNQNATRSPELLSSNILSKSSVSSAVTRIQDPGNLKTNSSDLDLDSPSNNGTDSLKPDSSNASDNTVQGPPIVGRPGSSNSLIVNTRQRGNPILKSVRNVPWEYGNIVPDYVMGQSNCALYLSLRYHQLHPNYIHDRLKLMGKSYDLRVMLVQVDVKEPHHMLKDLAKICLLADCTLILAFSPEEAGRYLETYKIFENKPPEAIMEKTEENFMAKFTDCLTRVKSVNRTDCATLISHFGTLTNIMEAAEEDLSLCPGFGPQKAKRLHSTFHEPFLRAGTIDKHS